MPIAQPDNPRIFQGDLILAGTMSGAMDPMIWFGILGATVTGKVAALAITDRERAIRDFQRFTRHFRAAYYFKNKVHYRMRAHVALQEKMVNLIGTKRVEKLAKMTEIIPQMPGSMPGFARVIGCF